MSDLDITAALHGMTRPGTAEVSANSHHFIVLSQLNAWLAEQAVPFSRGVLLDLGCGGQPYRDLFAPAISKYLGADVATAAGVALDIQLSPGQPVPLPSGSVDTILSTQTLEHVYDVPDYLRECQRLLRSGGRLVMTAPMHWRQHEVPFDYWRFTRFGLEQLLKDSGFGVRQIAPCGDLYSVLGQCWLDHLNEAGKSRAWLSGIVNRIALALDRRYPDGNETLLWMCLAEKT